VIKLAKKFIKKVQDFSADLNAVTKKGNPSGTFNGRVQKIVNLGLQKFSAVLENITQGLIQINIEIGILNDKIASLESYVEEEPEALLEQLPEPEEEPPA